MIEQYLTGKVLDLEKEKRIVEANLLNLKKRPKKPKH
jgi:hypothetical protein